MSAKRENKRFFRRACCRASHSPNAQAPVCFYFFAARVVALRAHPTLKRLFVSIFSPRVLSRFALTQHSSACLFLFFRRACCRASRSPNTQAPVCFYFFRRACCCASRSLNAQAPVCFYFFRRACCCASRSLNAQAPVFGSSIYREMRVSNTGYLCILNSPGTATVLCITTPRNFLIEKKKKSCSGAVWFWGTF